MTNFAVKILFIIAKHLAEDDKLKKDIEDLKNTWSVDLMRREK